MKKQTISILYVLVGFITGVSVFRRIRNKDRCKERKMSEKHLALFLMMNQWIQVKQEEKNLADYLIEKGYKNIAIYGMSYVGETLINELKNTNINILYGVDKRADSIYSDIPLISLEDELKDVDAVIVTAITFFDEIEKLLSEKIDCPILSLEDILYEI